MGGRRALRQTAELLLKGLDQPGAAQRLAVRLSLLTQVLARLRVNQEVATVTCAGSSGLIVIWFTGTVSLTKVVTKVFRDGSHQVIR
jgi:hypothetical protein